MVYPLGLLILLWLLRSRVTAPPDSWTSLTSAAGFASLMLAPIPPVRVFGGFVAFGILAAWVLTVTLIPASVMLTREDKLLAKVGARPARATLLERLRPLVGRFAFRRRGTVVLGAIVLLSLGIWGLTRIVVNDNPVKWFKPDHKIRIADAVMNRLFAWASPDEEDYYLNPELRYSISDEMWVAAGGNLFGGTENYTFLGQFDRNDNLYATLRYGF